jgi:hypothetical protein
MVLRNSGAQQGWTGIGKLKNDTWIEFAHIVSTNITKKVKVEMNPKLIRIWWPYKNEFSNLFNIYF